MSIVFLGTPSLYKLFSEVIVGKCRHVEIVKIFPTNKYHSRASFPLRYLLLMLMGAERLINCFRLKFKYFYKLRGVDIFLFCRNFNVDTYFLFTCSVVRKCERERER